MWIDADDIVSDEDQRNILELKKTLSNNTSVVMMKYHTSFGEDGKPTFSYYRERLLRRKDNFQWNGRIHEAITPSGIIIYSDIAVTHKKIKVSDSMRNLKIFDKMIDEGIKMVPREQFYYARELYFHKKYDEAYKIFRQFISEGNGWKENNISIYWYMQALSCKRNDSTGVFVQTDCFDFIPLIQLCLCFYALGDYKNAIMYNEKAEEIKPNHPSYLCNKKFFYDLKKMK